MIACVGFAREHDLPVSVRGGGHSIAGKAICDDGLMIDLSAMKGIRVDPATSTVRAEPGLTIGEFDRETQAFGLATTMGVISTTGIAGLTLGGGMGWLIGKHGLACDNVIAMDVVTADGRLLKASEQENPDLFWGMRGGGGNFGIVTSFEYRLHQLGPSLAAACCIRSIRPARCCASIATSPCPDLMSSARRWGASARWMAFLLSVSLAVIRVHRKTARRCSHPCAGLAHRSLTCSVR